MGPLWPVLAAHHGLPPPDAQRRLRTRRVRSQRAGCARTGFADVSLGCRRPRLGGSRDSDAVTGGEDAFRTLYRAHTPALYAMALRLTGSDQNEAEDLVQETWVRATRKMSAFRGESALPTRLDHERTPRRHPTRACRVAAGAGARSRARGPRRTRRTRAPPPLDVGGCGGGRGGVARHDAPLVARPRHWSDIRAPSLTGLGLSHTTAGPP